MNNDDDGIEIEIHRFQGRRKGGWIKFSRTFLLDEEWEKGMYEAKKLLEILWKKAERNDE